MTKLQDYYKTYQKPTVDICKETPYYFAYGMNTDPQQMMLRTGMPVAIGRCMLRDHAFRFALHADVYPREGTNTLGVLWELDDEQFASLDTREGYPYYYDRKIVEVECNGQMYRAWMYYMTPGHATYEPSKGYYDMLVRGYDTFMVDKTQIEQALKESTVAAVVSKKTADEYKVQRQTIAYSYVSVPVAGTKRSRRKQRRKDTRVFASYSLMLFHAPNLSRSDYKMIEQEAKTYGESLETLAREYIESGWVYIPDHWIVQTYTRHSQPQ